MSEEIAGAFDSIESALDFMAVFDQSIDEARRDVDRDLATAMADGNHRRVQALELVLFKMEALSTQVQKSSRLLNDLRTLRRLLFNERELAAALDESEAGAPR